MSKDYKSRRDESEKVGESNSIKKKKLKEAFQEFLYQKKHADKLSERTLKEHETHFKNFCDFLKKIGKKVTYVHEVDQALCLKYWIYLDEVLGLKESTRRIRCNPLRAQFYFYLEEKGYILKNPWVQKSISLTAKDNTPRWLKKEQVRLIMNSIDSSSHEGLVTLCLLKVLLATGMRIASALYLNEEDIDFESKLLRFYDFKNKRDVYVKLNNRLAQLLKMLLKRNSKVKNRTPALFIKADGTRLSYDSAKRRIYKIRKETGVKFTFHSFRHTFATWFIIDGGNREALKKLKIWKSSKALDVYVDFDEYAALDQFEKHSPLEQLDN
jgi:integrase/recombinase XerD